MSLKIIDISVTCDVKGCSAHIGASPEAVKLAGWQTRYIHDGQAKLDIMPTLLLGMSNSWTTVCPDCVKNGYWKKLERPQADGIDISPDAVVATKPCAHCSGTGTNKPTGLHSEKCKNCEGSGRVPA